MWKLTRKKQRIRRKRKKNSKESTSYILRYIIVHRTGYIGIRRWKDLQNELERDLRIIEVNVGANGSR